MELLAEVLDVVVGHLGGVDVVLNGVVLCGQAEGVIADGEQDVVALHPLLPADDVHGGEGPCVAHVEPLAGGIGELDQAEELLPSLVPRDGGEGLLLQPLFLPLLFDTCKIVLHAVSPSSVFGLVLSLVRARPVRAKRVKKRAPDRLARGVINAVPPCFSRRSPDRPSVIHRIMDR